MRAYEITSQKFPAGIMETKLIVIDVTSKTVKK
jgi:hypothetical protein